jgi:hypothetical protein
MKDVKKGARPGFTKEKPAAPAAKAPAAKAKALAVASAAKVAAAAAPPSPRPVEKPAAPVAQAKVEAPKVEAPKVAAQRSEPAKAPVPPAAPAPVPAVAAPIPRAPVAKAESAKPTEQPKPKIDAPVAAKPVSAAGVGAVSAPAISQAAAAPVAAVLKSGDQANVVFAKAQENSEALRKAAAASANAVAHGFIEINNKVLDLLRAQSDATFALWRSTVEAGSLSDAIRVQSSGVRQAYETTASQWRDIAETTGRVVEEAVKPIRQVLTPGLH